MIVAERRDKRNVRTKIRWQTSFEHHAFDSISVLTLHKVVTVLAEHQEHVRDLSSNRRHVVGVKVLLDDLKDRKVFVQHEGSSDGEKNIGSVDSLLDDLEGDQDGRSGRVDSSTDQDQTKEDTNQSITDDNGDISDDSELESSHVLGDFVGGLFRLLPFDKNPSHGDSGVDGADDGKHGEDTGCQSGTTKTLSSLLQLLHLFLVHGFLIRHLDELLVRLSFGRHGELIDW